MTKRPIKNPSPWSSFVFILISIECILIQTTSAQHFQMQQQQHVCLGHLGLARKHTGAVFSQAPERTGLSERSGVGS